MRFLESLHSAAKANPQRIILADTDDQRVLDAADYLNTEGLAETLVAGRDFNALDDPLTASATLVQSGWAAGCVAGATRSTADVLRVALSVLGVAPGVESLNSCFLMVLPDGHPIVYGDCAVLPDPSDQELACVAICCAETFMQLTNSEPRVAMLSFSTKGSAEHRRVSKVRRATEIARQRVPDLKIDGELQFDAAWVPEIGLAKAADSGVAGRANVFVFPDLDAANIAYKITERLGGALAIGPLLQGLNGVMHDLSRGCSSEDIVNVAVIASIQAAATRSRRGCTDSF